MRVWVARLALTFGLWLVVAVGAGIAGAPGHPVVLALYVGVLAALVFLFLDVSAETRSRRWPRARQEPVRERGEDPRLQQLRRVVDQHLDSREVGDTLQRHLGGLADRRLMSRHGLTRDADPDAAARMLGPELWAVLAAGPPYPRLTTGQIDQLLRRIEEL